jgi:hypothetical protein
MAIDLVEYLITFGLLPQVVKAQTKIGLADLITQPKGLGILVDIMVYAEKRIRYGTINADILWTAEAHIW